MPPSNFKKQENYLGLLPDCDYSRRRASELTEADINCSGVNVDIQIKSKTASQQEDPFLPANSCDCACLGNPVRWWGRGREMEYEGSSVPSSSLNSSE